jgi:hypothetical protein
VNHSIDQHIVTFRPVQNEVLTYRKCADAGHKIVTLATGGRYVPSRKNLVVMASAKRLAVSTLLFRATYNQISSRSASASGARRCAISETWRAQTRDDGDPAA